MIDVPTFCECLHCHHEFAENTLGVTIIGIGCLKVGITHMGTNVTLAKMIKQLQDNGKPLFSGIKPTKFINLEGHYLLLTQKHPVNKAKAKFDNVIENLVKEEQLDKLQIKDKFICCINQIQSKAVPIYAVSIKAQFKPMDSVQVPAKPCLLTATHNAWNHSPSLKFTQENFPELTGEVTPTHHHANKKQCTANGSLTINADNTDHSSLNPLVGPTQTELTDG
jgi:hypothetical protein